MNKCLDTRLFLSLRGVEVKNASPHNPVVLRAPTPDDTIGTFGVHQKHRNGKCSVPLARPLAWVPRPSSSPPPRVTLGLRDSRWRLFWKGVTLFAAANSGRMKTQCLDIDTWGRVGSARYFSILRRWCWWLKICASWWEMIGGAWLHLMEHPPVSDVDAVHILLGGKQSIQRLRRLAKSSWRLALRNIPWSHSRTVLEPGPATGMSGGIGLGIGWTVPKLSVAASTVLVGGRVSGRKGSVVDDSYRRRSFKN